MMHGGDPWLYSITWPTLQARVALYNIMPGYVLGYVQKARCSSDIALNSQSCPAACTQEIPD